jgi:hypothetical protein
MRLTTTRTELKVPVKSGNAARKEPTTRHETENDLVNGEHRSQRIKIVTKRFNGDMNEGNGSRKRLVARVEAVADGDDDV